GGRAAADAVRGGCAAGAGRGRSAAVRLPAGGAVRDRAGAPRVHGRGAGGAGPAVGAGVRGAGRREGGAAGRRGRVAGGAAGGRLIRLFCRARRSPRGTAGPGSEVHAHRHRFVDEGDAEGAVHTGDDLPGEGQQVLRRRAAAVGQREGVLGGDAGGAGAVALGEPGLVDQPGGGRLGPALTGRVGGRLGVGAEVLPHARAERLERVGGEDRV